MRNTGYCIEVTVEELMKMLTDMGIDDFKPEKTMDGIYDTAERKNPFKGIPKYLCMVYDAMVNVIDRPTDRTGFGNNYELLRTGNEWELKHEGKTLIKIRGEEVIYKCKDMSSTERNHANGLKKLIDYGGHTVFTPQGAFFEKKDGTVVPIIGYDI